MDNNLTNRTLTRHCFDGVCHCDWRLTIYGCEETNAMWWIYLVNIILSALVITVGTLAAAVAHEGLFLTSVIKSITPGIGLLIHRLGFKGHSLWDYKRGKGCLRPKPVDCMLCLLTVYNIRK